MAWRVKNEFNDPWQFVNGFRMNKELIDSVDLIMNKIKFWREKESQRKIKQL
jgi:hypothetical protein